MSVDGGLPTKALVNDAPQALGRKQSHPGRGGPGRAFLAVLIAVQLAWVAALVYGVHRGIEIIGGLA